MLGFKLRGMKSKSIGSGLFLSVMGGAVIGLGSIAILFYQVLQQQAETQIQDTLSTEVNTIESKLTPVKQSLRNLGGMTQLLQDRGIQDPNAYQALQLDFFLKRPLLVMGISLQQTPHGILKDRQWYAAYYYADQNTPSQIGKRLPFPNNKVLFADLVAEDNAPNQDYYKDTIAAGKDTWLQPYEWNHITMATLNHLLFDKKHKLIGFVAMDVNMTALSKEIRPSVIRNTGYFVVLSEKGRLVSYPPDPSRVRQGYESIPGLKLVWPQLQQGSSGLLRSRGSYWAFQRIPSTNWLMLAEVPQSVVLLPVLTITLGGAVGAGVVMALVVILFVRQLNYRLKPILDECKKLAEVDAQRDILLSPEGKLISADKLSQKKEVRDVDEIEVLTQAFNQMTSQLKGSFEELELRVEQRTTELKEAKEAADTANQSKSEFLTNMSHELRTPLNGILGYAQILRGSSIIPHREKQQIDIISQCGKHLLTLINDILDLSKIEANKMELYPVEFHLPAFMQGVTEMCRIKAESKGIQFNYECEGVMPIGVLGDDKRLRQILINLLSNAIKFTDKGKVDFLTSVEKIDDHLDSRGRAIYRLLFRVEDTGIGVAPDHLDKIFLPFEQVGNQKRQAEGTGLGLAISQKIAELMGSKIKIQSQLGKGSIFWFGVELTEANSWIKSSQTLEQRAIIGYEGSRRKVLVADDRWENRSVLVNLLEPLGFEIIEAEDGQVAIEKATESNPDLVITDIAMPVMDGYTFINHFRQTKIFAYVPLIVSSASVFESDRQKSLDAGATGFLPKPVESEELFAVMQRVMELKWIYADENKTESLNKQAEETSSGEMVLPSTQEIELLLELCCEGLVREIRDQLERMAQTNRQLVPFAQKFMKLTKEYKLKQIRSLLEEYLT